MAVVVGTDSGALTNLAAGQIGIDPSIVRLAVTGLTKGADTSMSTGVTTFLYSSTINDIVATALNTEDWRVRISLAASSDVFYKDASNEIQAPLRETDGVIFPYTPSITVTHVGSYSAQPLTHSNYSQQYYNNSDVQDIQIQGEFTVQNANEGRYLLAAIYFFRSATKMFFGDDAKNQSYTGNPPPMVFLNGYGSHYFPHVPCILSSFAHTLPPDTDYINVPSPNGGNTRLPAISNVTITLKPVYSRKGLHDNFGLSDFAAGKLVTGGYL